MRFKLIFLSAFLAALVLFAALAEPDILTLLDAFGNDFGIDACSAAENIEPLDDLVLSEADMEIYRLAFAHGYWASEYPEAADLFMEYHLNISTHKFHRPSCMAAINMSAGNKSIEHARRSEILAAGYVPCKICNP